MDGEFPKGFTLWLPHTLTAALMPRLGPRLHWVSRVSDQPGATVSTADFWDRMQGLDPIAVIRALAGINIGLALDRFSASIEHAARARYIRPEYLFLVAPGPKHPNEGVFFARAGVLVAMKCEIVASMQPTQPAPIDPHVVGDLSLAANEIAFANPTGVPCDLDDFDIVVNFVPVWDLYNPRFLGYSLARAYRMIELFQGTDPTVVTLRSRLNMNSALEFDGLPLINFAAVVFGLFAHVRARADVNALVHSSGGLVVDGNSILFQTSVPKSDLDKFLSKRSWTFDQFQKEIAGGKPLSRPEFASRVAEPGFDTDFRVFREHPFMDLGAGQHLVLDLQFLEELVGPGMFFHLLSSLQRDQRAILFDLWGRIFELLVIELFEHFYPQSPSVSIAQLFRADYRFEAKPPGSLAGGQVDGILDFGSAIFLFEFKHFLLSQPVKDSLNRAILQKELCVKLVENEKGEPKALRQLVNACVAVRNGAIPTVAGASGTTGANALLYPVVVVADPAMEALGVNSFLNEIFYKYAVKIKGELRPLTIMSIQELEEVLAYTSAGAFTWAELLDSRFLRAQDDTDSGLRRVALCSVHQGIYDMLAAKRAPSLPNEFRRAQFDRIGSKILSRYSGN